MPGSSCYAYYAYYINYINFMCHTNYTHYLQVYQDLGLADHVWQDKRTMITQSVDNLGDQFRPAMRAGWLSYIHTTYPQRRQRMVPALWWWEKTCWWSPVESMLLLAAAAVKEDAIGLISAMNSNTNCNFLFCNNANNLKNN